MKMIKWLPHPVLSLLILLSWLMLMNSVSAGVIALGVIIALLMPWVTRVFWPGSLRVTSSTKMLKYVGMVMFDIVVANLAVLRLILGPKRNIKPAWIEVPLDISDPVAITILANTITLTPGTITAEISPGHKTLLIHALSAEDPAQVVAEIKERYEAPLKEMFE